MRSPQNTTPTILQTSFWLNASIRNQCCCGQCMLPRHRHTNATAAAATIVTSEQWNWIFCLICLGCSRTEACARCVWTMLLAVLLQNKRGNLCAVHVLVGKNAIWNYKRLQPTLLHGTRLFCGNASAEKLQNTSREKKTDRYTRTCATNTFERWKIGGHRI